MTEPAAEQTSEDIISPVDSPAVSDVFGDRVNPVTGRAEFHKGLDIAAAENTPVYAAFDGYVADCGYSDSYGYYIKIQGEKYACLYGHLNKILLNKGDKVTQGQQTALSGNTGQSTGPHLHFELYEGDTLIDPSFVISK
ncbi:MAG: M23 family metallopeptidase [Firmicutes bacterium]|nr:M23 family metallopeptidase [Bacillota bacterium]